MMAARAAYEGEICRCEFKRVGPNWAHPPRRETTKFRAWAVLAHLDSDGFDAEWEIVEIRAGD